MTMTKNSINLLSRNNRRGEGMKKLTCRSLFMIGVLCAGLLGCLTALPSTARAGGIVSCKYLRAGGHNIQLELQVAGKAPVTIIVLQNFPVGVRIVDSRPAMKKYNKKKGQAKWLLKNVGPGRKILSMELDKSVKPTEINGELRYRPPNGGPMETMLITP